MGCCCTFINQPLHDKLQELENLQLGKILNDEDELNKLTFLIYKEYCLKNFSSYIGKTDAVIKRECRMLRAECLQFIHDLKIKDYEDNEAKLVLENQIGEDVDLPFSTQEKLAKLHLKTKIQSLILEKENEERNKQRELALMKLQNQSNKNLMGKLEIDEEQQMNKEISIDLDITVTEEDVRGFKDDGSIRCFLSLFYKFLHDCNKFPGENNIKWKCKMPFDKEKLFLKQYNETGKQLATHTLKHIIIKLLNMHMNSKKDDVRLFKLNQSHYMGINENVQKQQANSFENKDIRNYQLLSQNHICSFKYQEAQELLLALSGNLAGISDQFDWKKQQVYEKISRYQSQFNAILSKQLKNKIINAQQSSHQDILSIKILQIITESQLPETPVIIECIDHDYIDLIREQFELNSDMKTYKKQERLVRPDSVEMSESFRSRGARALHESFGMRSTGRAKLLDTPTGSEGLFTPRDGTSKVNSKFINVEELEEDNLNSSLNKQMRRVKKRGNTSTTGRESIENEDQVNSSGKKQFNK